MTVYPVSTIRTSDVLSQGRLIRQVNADNIALEKLYEQLSTGRRVNTLSDDPAAAITAVSLQASQEYSAQLIRNADSAEGYLNVTDNVIRDIDNLLIEARGTVVAAAQVPLAEAERLSYAETLDQTIERIVAASSQSFRGHFALGGAIDRQSPLSFEGEAIVWNGEPTRQATRISRDWLLETGVNAEQVLGVGRPIITGSDLNVGLSRDTRFEDLFDGRGLTPGVFRISDGTGWTEIDLRAAKTIGDLEDAIESVNLDGRELSVTIGPSSLSIDYADGLGGQIAIEDLGEIRTAERLGLENPFGTLMLPLTSDDLRPTLTSRVRLSDLNGGAGYDVSEGFTIHQGADQFDIDLSAAETVEDVLVAINTSGANVRALINDETSTIEIQALASGVDYSIAENGGDAATLLGIRTATALTRLDELNQGLGFDTSSGADFTITRTDGVVLSVDIDGAESIGDVLDLINTDPANTGAAAVTATLRTDGNGISLSSVAGAEDLRVQNSASSNVASVVGLVGQGEDEAIANVQAGVSTISGSDYLPIAPESTLDTLIRLRDAVAAGDIPEITRLSPLLDAHLQQSSLVRGDVGSRSQNLQSVRRQTEEISIELDSQLSNQVDADFAEVISEMTSRQTALEASLRVIAQISQLSVLNFL